MTIQQFDKIVKQLNKKLPVYHFTSTEFGGVSYERKNVEGMNEPVLALIYNRKVFGFADPFTIYIDKDCCNTAKRIAFIEKRAGYYHDIVEV